MTRDLWSKSEPEQMLKPTQLTQGLKQSHPAEPSLDQPNHSQPAGNWHKNTSAVGSHGVLNLLVMWHYYGKSWLMIGFELEMKDG